LNQQTLLGVIVVAYILISGIASQMIANRHERVKTVREYVAAGNSVGFLLLGSAFIATWCSSYTIFAAGEAAFVNGISGLIWYPIGVAGPVLATFFLARTIKRKIPEGLTLAHWVGMRFGNGARVIISMSILFAMFLEVVAGLYAGSNLLEILGGIPVRLGMAILVISILAYALTGGLPGVLVAQFIRVCTFILLGVICIPWIISGIGGVGVLYDAIGTKLFDINAWGPLNMQYFWIALFGYTVGSAAVWQRVFAAKNEEVIEKSFLIFAFGWFPFAILGGTLGLLAHFYHIEGPASLAIQYAIQKTNIVLQILIALSLLSLLVSSVDAFLNAASCIYAVDFEAAFWNKGKSDTVVLRNTKIFTVVFVLASAYFALESVSILGLLTVSGMVLFGCVFVIIASLYSDKITRKAGFLGMLIGAALAVVSVLLKWDVTLSALAIFVVPGIVCFIVTRFDSNVTKIEYFEGELGDFAQGGLSKAAVYTIYFITFVTAALPFYSALLTGSVEVIMSKPVAQAVIWLGPVGCFALVFELIYFGYLDKKANIPLFGG